MKKRLVILLVSALMLVSPAVSKDAEFRPSGGFVPDAETAEKISEIILARIFGETETNLEKPLTATLQDDVWIVKGTMPPNMLGGIAELHISKKDGAILFLSHGQ